MNIIFPFVLQTGKDVIGCFSTGLIHNKYVMITEIVSVD